MKKYISMSLLILNTQASFALRIPLPGGGEIKGKDPRIIVDVANGVQKAGKEVANGVRDVVAGVANATGIADVIDSNTETFQNLGRLKACAFALCASEYLREQELERVRGEQKKALDAEIAEYEGKLKENEASERMKKNIHLLSAREKYQNSLDEQFGHIDSILGTLSTYQSIIKIELEYREKLKSLGLQKQIPNRDLEPAALVFEQAAKVDIYTAAENLDAEMLRVAQATGRSLARIQAELTRILADETLSALFLTIQDRLSRLQQRRSNLLLEKSENEANIQALKSEVTSGGR